MLPAGWNGQEECLLRGHDARRVSSILRLRPGDSFPALAPDGSGCVCTIVESGRGLVRLAVARDPAGAATVTAAGAGYKPDIRSGHGKRVSGEPEPSAGAQPQTPPARSIGVSAAGPVRLPLPRLVLAVGVLRGSKMDDVVRAATEAGVSTIIPLATARSVSADAIAGRVGRIRRVVSEALGQSGSTIPTEVTDPLSVRNLADLWPAVNSRRVCVFFHETPLAQATVHGYCSGNPEEVLACVGPEGGFDRDEVRTMVDAGYGSAWLGPTVLRAETAALFGLASLRIVCLERAAWSMTTLNE